MDEQPHPLNQIPLFASLSEATLTRVAAAAIRRTYAPDEIILVEGQPCTSAYFIESGHVYVFRLAPSGREQVLAKLGPGQAFNTVPPFEEEGTNPAGVRALTEVTLYALLVDDFRRLVRTRADLAYAILRDFAQRLHELADLVEDLSLRSVRGRLARFLLERAEEGEVERAWTQDEIAARLGTVRDVVGRNLRALADAGLIEIRRQRIILLDREGLEAETLC
jgi:CRP/FNR family transcriptional regulator